MVAQKELKPVEQIDLGSFRLGEQDTLIGFSTRSGMIELAQALIKQSERELIYYADHLDDSLLGQKLVSDGLEGLIRRNRLARIKILVKSSNQLVHTGNRIVEMLRSHMPEAECRIRPQRSQNYGGTFILLDGIGYMYQPSIDRFAGTGCFYSVSTIEALNNLFNAEWGVSGPDPEMQPLTI